MNKTPDTPEPTSGFLFVRDSEFEWLEMPEVSEEESGIGEFGDFERLSLNADSSSDHEPDKMASLKTSELASGRDQRISIQSVTLVVDSEGSDEESPYQPEPEAPELPRRTKSVRFAPQQTDSWRRPTKSAITTSFYGSSSGASSGDGWIGSLPSDTDDGDNVYTPTPEPLEYICEICYGPLENVLSFVPGDGSRCHSSCYWAQQKLTKMEKKSKGKSLRKALRGSLKKIITTSKKGIERMRSRRTKESTDKNRLSHFEANSF